MRLKVDSLCGRWHVHNCRDSPSKMTSSLALVLLFGGAAVCAELALRGGYRERSNQDDPEYLELAHYATSTWSAQQPGKTHFDTVVEVLKVETQVSVSCPLDQLRYRRLLAAIFVYRAVEAILNVRSDPSPEGPTRSMS